MDPLPSSFVLNDAAQSGLSDEENEDIRASSIIKTEIDLGADDILEEQVRLQIVWKLFDASSTSLSSKNKRWKPRAW